MRIVMRVYEIENKKYVDDVDELMSISGQDKAMGFEAVAVQDDGTIIICDKCGNFGYLDPEKYKINIFVGA